MKMLLALAGTAIIIVTNMGIIPSSVRDNANMIVSEAFNACDEECFAQEVTVGSKEVSLGEGRTIFEALFGCGKWPCAIAESPGGDYLAFALAGKAATRLVRASFSIEDECSSGCSIFADIARKQVCLRPRAVLGFHQGHSEETNAVTGETEMYDWFVPFYSFDLDRLVRKKGGYQKERMTLLFGPTARTIWKACGEDPFALRMQNMLGEILPSSTLEMLRRR